MKQFKPGDRVEPGHPANFSSVPGEWVFLSDNREAAEFWIDFLGGESMAEKLGYWPDVFLYEVEPEGHLEPDPWCVYFKVEGCWMSRKPFKIVKDVTNELQQTG
jgi:hypothetical protein